MQSRARKMVLVKCLVDAKAKKEKEVGMFNKETSGPGEE